jgi:hypothetical protein
LRKFVGGTDMRRSAPAMMKRFVGRLAMVAVVAVAVSAPAKADIVISALNVPYTQDFDSLISTGSATFVNDSTLPGWELNAESGLSYAAGTGSSTTGDIYSYGASSSSDRALGYLGSGSNDYFNAVVVFTNSTGATIDEVVVSYIGEQWRSGGTAPTNNNNSLTFAWRVGETISVPGSISTTGWTTVAALRFAPVQFTAGGALDGNLSVNQTSFSNISISGLSWPVGEKLALRWIGNDGAGADAGLAIDNLQVTAVPEPSTLGLAAAGVALAGLGAWKRRRRSGSAVQAA